MKSPFPLVDSLQKATIRLDVSTSQAADPQVDWVYALVAPFPTVTDGITADELRAAWNGSAPAPFKGYPLLMEESTLAAFTLLWGAPAAGTVRSVPADELLDTAWKEMPSWAIIPFESLEPRWKLLTIDGQSPIRKSFNQSTYPLTINFSLHRSEPRSSYFSLPASNYDSSKLTTVIMTGVTALVRATAYTMERKGVTYPGRDIRDWLVEADITHISNEVPFYTGCDFPNPGRYKLVFCSSPRYIDLLTDMGADVIELTGNHFGDYGTNAMLETLAIYKDKGIPYFGGGANLEDARKPLLLENHGNRIAFVGCNRPDVGKFPTATENRPGASPCDLSIMSEQIRALVSQGYVVIATFQWNERLDYSPIPNPLQVDEFRLMADAGAAIVSGSQAHFPLTMEFYQDAFIHYGLGNLFFDQMGDCCAFEYNRKEFLDRYVIYNGRLISAELLTALLEDFSRPRPMTPEERRALLLEYFYASGWIPFAPTPTPTVTLTLTPLALPPFGGTQPVSATETPTPTP